VYCGSSTGAEPAFSQAAVALGEVIAGRGLRLVYGGGKVGLMGIIADTVLEAGGEVTGVITEALVLKEVAHASVELEVVRTMHERKAAMADRADAFVMLPGGFGTLDEFFEALTWTQLGVHEKPCGILDVDGYFEHLLRFLDTTVANRFVHPDHAAMVVAESDPNRLLDRLSEWQPPPVEKWLDRPNR